MKKIYDDPELSKIYRTDVKFEIPENYKQYVQQNSGNDSNNSSWQSSIDSNDFNGNDPYEYSEGDY